MGGGGGGGFFARKGGGGGGAFLLATVLFKFVVLEDGDTGLCDVACELTLPLYGRSVVELLNGSPSSETSA